MKTNDTIIVDLMKKVNSGLIQLPEFQRGWVWSDSRIKALIASLTNNYPVGAVMFLSYDAQNNKFKYRTIEGAPTEAYDVIPDSLILDGQQRLTSIYSALYNAAPVHTRTDKGDEIRRYYYIDIAKAISTDIDREDAIFSVPETRKILSDFNRKTDYDVSTADLEYEQKVFPLNIILDPVKSAQWQNAYYAKHKYDATIIQEFTQFWSSIVLPLMQYTIPVITLDKNTPKAAVCQVFENVNTGGVSLTVFELVTAIFAMDNFDLRKSWEEKSSIFAEDEILNIVANTDFLTALTLLSSYMRNRSGDNAPAISCKRKDVLNLTLDEYKKYQGSLVTGFQKASKLLQEERIFSNAYLPYTTQLIPLSVICSVLEMKGLMDIASVKAKIKKWYWCGVFGELYGAANETRYANDMAVVDWCINDGADIPKTVQDSYFNAGRLLKLQTRQSAAYKGIMALILQNHSKDFISGDEMDFVMFQKEHIDIHHIFPRSYCEKSSLPKKKWNSVVNKTPITESTNREIGGVAPSKYLAKIEKSKKVDAGDLNIYLSTHLIEAEDCRKDDFDSHIFNRAIKILDAIENATGKTVSGRDSEDTINDFGRVLIKNNSAV